MVASYSAKAIKVFHCKRFALYSIRLSDHSPAVVACYSSDM